MPWMKVTLERRQLYDEVWTESVTKVAQRYGVTNTGLSKICKRLGVPIPGRGYWARIAAGWAPQCDPLPMMPPDHETTHVLRRWAPNGDGLDVSDPEPEASDETFSTEPRIIIPSASHPLHPLVREHESVLRRGREPLKESFFAENACLDVRVSNAALERALRVMSALLQALEGRGFPVEVTLPKRGTRDQFGNAAVIPSHTGAHIRGVFVPFRIEEQQDVLPATRTSRGESDGSPDRARRPNGRLTLKIVGINRGSRRVTWAEGKKLRLEESLESFIRSLVVTAAGRRAESLAAERIHCERQRDAERDAEEQHLQDQIEEMRQDLRRRIEGWCYASQIRDLALAMEAAALNRGEAVDNTSPLGLWIAWAREEAGRMESAAIGGVPHFGDAKAR